MKKLFLSSLGVNLLVMVLNLVTGILSARYLGPEGRGELAAATRWSNLFMVIFTIGLPGAVIYLGKQFPEKQRDYLGVYLLIGSLLGLAGAGIGNLLLPLLFANQPEHVAKLAALAMLTVPFTLLIDGLIGSLQTLNQFHKVLGLRVINPVGQLGIIVLLLLSGHYTVGTFILCSLLWSASLFGIALLWVLQSLKPRLHNVLSLGRELFRKGLQIYAGFIVSTFGGNLDHMIISLFLTTYTLGLYAVSSSIATILPSVLIGTIGTYLFPKLMDMLPDERKVQAARIHGTLLYGTLAVAIVGGTLLPFVLPVMYGAEYKAAVLLGQILLICAPINVAYVVLSNFFSTEGKFHYITFAEITGLVTGVLATALLLRWLGGVGAAIGVCMIASIKWGTLVYRARRYGVSWGNLFRLDPEISAGIVLQLKRMFSRFLPSVAGKKQLRGTSQE